MRTTSKIPEKLTVRVDEKNLPKEADLDISKYSRVIVDVYGGDVDAFLRDAMSVRPSARQVALLTKKTWESIPTIRGRKNGFSQANLANIMSSWNQAIQKMAKQKELAKQYQKEAQAKTLPNMPPAWS